MKFQIDSIRDLTVIRPDARVLDYSNSGAFRAALLEWLPADAKVILDLGRIRMLDSSGCGAILACLRHLSPDGEGPGELKLCVDADAVRAVLEVVRFHRILEIYNTREEALRSFDSVPGAYSRALHREALP